MDSNLKSQMQSKSNDELLKIYHIRKEYTPEAIKIIEGEFERRGIAYNSDPIVEDLSESEQVESILLKENWIIIIILILIPFGVLLVGDMEIAQRAGRKIVPAIACLVGYSLFMRFMFKFPSEKRFTHYSIIYFIIWVVLMIISS